MDSVFDIASAHRGGYFLTRDLKDLGLHDRDIYAAVKAGVIERLRHGIYARSDVARGLSPQARHLLIAHATYDRLGPGYVMSHVTAAVRHTGQSTINELSDIHLTRLRGTSSRSEAGIIWHIAELDEDDVVEIDGRLYTRPARAAVEAASVTPVQQAMIQTSFVLRDCGVDADELHDLAERLQRTPGMRKARLAIWWAAPRSESVGEVLSMHMFRVGRVPIPDQQLDIVDAFGRTIARGDFEWTSDCHVGEFDGQVKYGALNDDVSDPGRVLVKEKRREDAIRATGRGVSRWMWPDLGAPAATCARINAAREKSRSLYARGRVHIV